MLKLDISKMKEKAKIKITKIKYNCQKKNSKIKKKKMDYKLI